MTTFMQNESLLISHLKILDASMHRSRLDCLDKGLAGLELCAPTPSSYSRCIRPHAAMTPSMMSVAIRVRHTVHAGYARAEEAVYG
jgi:hypothetical protein